MTDHTTSRIAGPRNPGGGRGRAAATPQRIPARGWKDVMIRAWNDSNEKNLSLVAGGVTYYIILALFPALAALVSIYGLIASRATVATTITALSGRVVPSAQKLISDELHHLVATSGHALGFGAIFGLLIALWSASRGMSGMISALDIAYGEPETRGFIRFNLLALGLTIVMLIGGIVLIGLVAVLPAVMVGIGGHGALKWLVLILEWPVLMALMIVSLAALYRYAPDRRAPRWQWTSPGAIIATLLWLIGSILFAVYVSHFSTYNKTYGSLGAVVLLLTWLWLSCYVILLGAEINGQAERQTRTDTTTGTAAPLGERGATAADTIGEAHP